MFSALSSEFKRTTTLRTNMLVGKFLLGLFTGVVLSYNLHLIIRVDTVFCPSRFFCTPVFFDDLLGDGLGQTTVAIVGAIDVVNRECTEYAINPSFLGSVAT